MIIIVVDLLRLDVYILLSEIIVSFQVCSCFISCFENGKIERDSKKYNILLGVLCGYPLIKMTSIFTIAFIKTPYQRYIYDFFMLAFIIGGGILGGKFPEKFCDIGSNIFENYIITKGLSYIFYGSVTPIDEQKLFDLAKIENFEKIEEMIKGLGLIYPLIFWGFLIIVLLLKLITFSIYRRKKNEEKYKEQFIKNNKKDEVSAETPKENEEKFTEVPYNETPKENEEKCIEVPYYETSN